MHALVWGTPETSSHRIFLGALPMARSGDCSMVDIVWVRMYVRDVYKSLSESESGCEPRSWCEAHAIAQRKGPRPLVRRLTPCNFFGAIDYSLKTVLVIVSPEEKRLEGLAHV